MNYGETLAYWYLRFNGFFLIQNFVLHPLADGEGSDKQAADIVLLAVRFPYVYEETGGQIWPLSARHRFSLVSTVW